MAVGCISQMVILEQRLLNKWLDYICLYLIFQIHAPLQWIGLYTGTKRHFAQKRARHLGVRCNLNYSLSLSSPKWIRTLNQFASVCMLLLLLHDTLFLVKCTESWWPFLLVTEVGSFHLQNTYSNVFEFLICLGY